MVKKLKKTRFTFLEIESLQKQKEINRRVKINKNECFIII